MIEMYLERLRGRKSSSVLKELIDEAMILELKNGKVYGGQLDDYECNAGVVISLYHCKLLDRKRCVWMDHDVMVRRGKEVTRDSLPDFWVKEARNILVLPKELRQNFALDDALQIYIDPHFKPLTGIVCDWDPGENWKNLGSEHHSLECEARLHEALTIIRTIGNVAICPNRQDKDHEYRMFCDAFDYVRRRLLMYAARVP
jgi:hypothetical protein